MLKCDGGHEMGWLGHVYWFCEACHSIFVSPKAGYIKRRER